MFTQNIEVSPHPAFVQSLCFAQTKVCSFGTNVTDKVTKGARLEKEALLLFLTRQVSSERSFPRKASSEGRTFVTNPYLVRKDNGKVGNLAFAPGKAQGGKLGLCKV